MSGEGWGGRDVACSVRGFYSRKSRQSRQRHRVIFCEIRGIITQWSVPSDMPSDGIEVGICNPRLCYRVTDPYTQKTANNMFAVTERHVFLFWFLCSYVYSWYSWYYNSCVLFGRCTQRPYPLMTHFSSLTTQNVLLFFCRKNSQLITHNSPLKIASTFCKTTNLLSDNQKVALSLGRSERNLYFCSI